MTESPVVEYHKTQQHSSLTLLYSSQNAVATADLTGLLTLERLNATASMFLLDKGYRSRFKWTSQSCTYIEQQKANTPKHVRIV